MDGGGALRGERHAHAGGEAALRDRVAVQPLRLVEPLAESALALAFARVRRALRLLVLLVVAGVAPAAAALLLLLLVERLELARLACSRGALRLRRERTLALREDHVRQLLLNPTQNRTSASWSMTGASAKQNSNNSDICSHTVPLESSGARDCRIARFARASALCKKACKKQVHTHSTVRVTD